MGVYQRLLPEFVLILLGLYLLATNILPQPGAGATSDNSSGVSSQKLVPVHGNANSVSHDKEMSVPLVLKGDDKFILAGAQITGRDELLAALREMLRRGVGVELVGDNDQKQEFMPWFAENIIKLRQELVSSVHPNKSKNDQPESGGR